jgi:hypothetical protein
MLERIRAEGWRVILDEAQDTDREAVRRAGRDRAPAGRGSGGHVAGTAA